MKKQTLTIIGYDGRPVTIEVGPDYWRDNTKEEAFFATGAIEGKGRVVLVQEDKR